MSTTIQIRRSATAGNIPLAASLVAGELAINTADHCIYFKDSSNTVRSIRTQETAKYYNNAATTLNASAAGTQFVAWGNVSHNTDTALLFVSSDGITVNKTGYYEVSFLLNGSLGSSKRKVSAAITVNGTAQGPRSVTPYALTYLIYSVGHSEIIYLTAGQKVGVMTFQEGATGTVTAVAGRGFLQVRTV